MKTSKIGCLPKQVRDELNGRIENNEPGAAILEWINRRVDVKRIIREKFGGKPVSKQNLSEWRKRGFSRWQINGEVLELTRELAELGTSLDLAQLAEHFLAAVTARYGGLMVTWDGKVEPEFNERVRLMRGLTKDATTILRMVGEMTTSKAERKTDAGELGGSKLRAMVKELLERDAEEPETEMSGEGADANCPGGTPSVATGILLREDATADKLVALPGTGDEPGMNGEAVKDGQGSQDSTEPGRDGANADGVTVAGGEDADVNCPGGTPSGATGILLREDATADKLVALPGTGDGTRRNGDAAEIGHGGFTPLGRERDRA